MRHKSLFQYVYLDQIKFEIYYQINQTNVKLIMFHAEFKMF